MLRDHEELKLVGLCIPRGTAHWMRMLMYRSRRVLGRSLQILFNDTWFSHATPVPVNPHALARRYGFEVLVTKVNHKTRSFGADLERLSPDVLFSIFWKRRFHADFLRLFRQSINYHNGAVPDYRGLRATSWSVYRGEIHSGFTVHRINEQLDCGNVLVEGAVPIDQRDSIFDIELRKTRLAVQYLPAVLDALAKELPGIPQREPHKYNNTQEIKRLLKIEEPASISSEELLRRIRAFGPAHVRLKDSGVWLSGLASRVDEPTASDRNVICLSDGYWKLKRSDRILTLYRRLSGR